jgi:hypothetical protein
MKNINDKYVATLLMKVSASGEIRDGSVVLYQPTNANIKTIPTNTFHAIFNTAEPTCNGEFKFLSVTGRSLYTLTYEHNTLAREAKVVNKTTSRTTENNCTDWFLVITVYYTDGSIENYEEYLTTTCSGCDDPTIESECPDHSGEGGNYVDYEYEKRRQQQWTVFQNDAHTIRVDAWDVLQGRSGAFTGMLAKGSKINWMAYYLWRENSHSGWFSGSSATSSVSGAFVNQDSGADVFTTSAQKTWTYSEAFP